MPKERASLVGITERVDWVLRLTNYKYVFILFYWFFFLFLLF